MTPRGVRSDRRPVSPLYRRIWETVNRIPAGRVATYGQIARLAGIEGQPRLVGYALHRLAADSRVPWHRVVNARGAISVRSGGGPLPDVPLQRRLLEREGVDFDSRGVIDLVRYAWRPRRRVLHRKESDR